VSTAPSVPNGRERAGSLRSPDIAKPARIPVTAGKNTANTTQKGSVAGIVTPAVADRDSTGRPAKNLGALYFTPHDIEHVSLRVKCPVKVAAHLLDGVVYLDLSSSVCIRSLF